MADFAAAPTLVLIDMGDVITHVTAHGFAPGSSKFFDLVKRVLGKHLRALEATHCLALRPTLLAGIATRSPDAELDAALAGIGVSSQECEDSVHAAAVMSYIARKAKVRGFRPILLTKQVALFHLLDEGVEICDPVTMRWTTHSEIFERFGVPPQLVVDALALQAAKGVGRKLAARILELHGSAATALSRSSGSAARDAIPLQVDAGLVAEALQRMALPDVSVQISPKTMEVPATARAAHRRI